MEVDRLDALGSQVHERIFEPNKMDYADQINRNNYVIKIPITCKPIIQLKLLE